MNDFVKNEISIKHWIVLFNRYSHRYRDSENDRKFKSFTGVAPQVAETIFQKYQDRDKLRHRKWLLLVLHYLKNAPTQDTGAQIFKISRPTYRKKLWETLLFLDVIMEEVQLEHRFFPFFPKSGPFENMCLVVDGTDCPIDRPKERSLRNLHSNGRHKENTYGRYNLKYTVAVQIVSGKICFVSKPEPGSKTDIRALKESNLFDDLEENESILADKGYQGHPNCLSPFKGKDLLFSEEAFNEVHASVRQIVECVFSRMKIFGVLKKRFSAPLWKHGSVFNVCANITNVSIERSPIWLNTNFYLTNHQ